MTEHVCSLLCTILSLCYGMPVSRPLGALNYLRIWHDNSGRGKFAGWYLNYVVVRDVQTKQRYHFVVNQWLAVEEDDGQVSPHTAGVTSLFDLAFRWVNSLSQTSSWTLYFFAYGDIAVPLTSCSHAGRSMLYIRLCLVVRRKLSVVRLTYWLSVWCYVTICCLYLLIFLRQDILDLASHLCVAQLLFYFLFYFYFAFIPLFFILLCLFCLSCTVCTIL